MEGVIRDTGTGKKERDVFEIVGIDSLVPQDLCPPVLFSVGWFVAVFSKRHVQK